MSHVLRAPQPGRPLVAHISQTNYTPDIPTLHAAVDASPLGEEHRGRLVSCLVPSLFLPPPAPQGRSRVMFLQQPRVRIGQHVEVEHGRVWILVLEKREYRPS